MLGGTVVVASPQGYELPPRCRDAVARVARFGGGVRVTNDPIDAVARADAIYTDVWASMGQERRGRARADLPALPGERRADGQRAGGALFMHCLPAHRGDEVTDEVIDSPRLVVFDQSENRLPRAEGAARPAGRLSDGHPHGQRPQPRLLWLCLSATAVTFNRRSAVHLFRPDLFAGKVSRRSRPSCTCTAWTFFLWYLLLPDPGWPDRRAPRGRASHARPCRASRWPLQWSERGSWSSPPGGPGACA
jgi:hypothetical protein